MKVSVNWYCLEPGVKTSFSGFLWLIKAAFHYYFFNEVVLIEPATEQDRQCLHLPDTDNRGGR